ncbi:single-stranded-DNA-specific exonuclease RecJ [Porphyromonas sp.]
MSQSWEIRSYTSEEETQARELASRLGLFPAMGYLLVARGIHTYEEAQNFFSPRLEELYDPFAMEDMTVAVERLHRAIEEREHILIYGDYDVDGTTAVALLYRYLRAQCLPQEYLHYYIPDRYDDGYGITLQGIDYAHQLGIGLIISVDTGIKATEEIIYARSLGIDFIVCDHHTPDETLPPATAILNPKRADNHYPFTELSGCGVAFKLVQGLAIYRHLPFDSLLPLLELLVLSIAQDRVSILGENRIFIYHGLQQLNSQPSIAITYLMRLGKIQPGRVDMASIYYELGPRINAAGRMAHGAESVKLLIAEDHATAEAQSQILDEYNRQRQELDQQVTREAITLVEADPQLEKQRLIILYRPEWNKGVMGIVAARLADRFHRPVLILSRSTGEYLAGSGRSAGGFDLYQAIQACSDCLENFGGHIFAAGLTIREDRLPEFRQRIQEYVAGVKESTSTSSFTPRLKVDVQLKPSEISRTLLRQVEMLYPFGTDNERPVFMTQGMRDAGGSRAVGKALQHLSLRMTDAYQRIRPLHGFALGLAHYAPEITRHKAFALCFELEENNFYPQSFLQLRVKDLCLESELSERLIEQ